MSSLVLQPGVHPAGATSPRSTGVQLSDPQPFLDHTLQPAGKNPGILEFHGAVKTTFSFASHQI